MKSFMHIDAESVAHGVALLGKYKSKAKIIAGGTDLLGALKDEILPGYPEVIINIKGIPGLDRVEENEGGLKIGSPVKLSIIASSPLIRGRYPMLADAAQSVASPVIRRMGTIGGNLCQDVRCWYYRYPNPLGGRIMCHRKGRGSCPAVAGDNRYHAIMGGKVCFAVCPSDIAVALTALDAKIDVAGPKSSRTIPIKDFFTPLGNALQSDEMVTGIKLPPPPEKAKQTFLKFTLRKPIDFAIVSVASAVTVEEGICTRARIVLGSVAPMPLRATGAEEAVVGRTLDGSTAEDAADAAIAGAKPLSMNAYKVEIAKALIKRAILGGIPGE